MTESAGEVCSSGPFKVSPSAYAIAYGRRRAGIVVALSLIVAGGLAVAGLYDVRFGILALMFVFLILPPLYLAGWLAICSRKDIVTVSRPQQWFFDTADNSIEICFYEFDDLNAEDRPASTLRICQSDVRRFTAGRTYALLELSGHSSHQLLLIPIELVPASYCRSFI